MKVLKKIWCAVIVYLAYRKMGYYSLFGVFHAVKSYFDEKNALRGDILTVERLGIPMGTLMCARDSGWLPPDTAFAKEMALIRQRHGGRLAYLGKFAVIPWLHGRLCGKQLLIRAVTEWSFHNNVDTVVMVVNPRHAPWYQALGAIEVARSGGTKGLEKAPAVLMVLEYQKSPAIVRQRRSYLAAKMAARDEDMTAPA